MILLIKFRSQKSGLAFLSIKNIIFVISKYILHCSSFKLCENSSIFESQSSMLFRFRVSPITLIGRQSVDYMYIFTLKHSSTIIFINYKNFQTNDNRPLIDRTSALHLPVRKHAHLYYAFLHSLCEIVELHVMVLSRFCQKEKPFSK